MARLRVYITVKMRPIVPQMTQAARTPKFCPKRPLVPKRTALPFCNGLEVPSVFPRFHTSCERTDLNCLPDRHDEAIRVEMGHVGEVCIPRSGAVSSSFAGNRQNRALTQEGDCRARSRSSFVSLYRSDRYEGPKKPRTGYVEDDPRHQAFPGRGKVSEWSCHQAVGLTYKNAV
jgi:hypothetical protein